MSSSQFNRVGALLVLTMVAAASVACMRPTPSPAEQLSKALNNFHGHLIFERYDEAAGYVPAVQREKFMDYYDDQQGDLHITEFEVARVKISDDEHTAQSEVMISWYRLPDMTVTVTRMDQSWIFDEEREVWEVDEQTVIKEHRGHLPR